MPLQIDAQTQYRYQRLLERIRQTQAQMRSLRFTLQQTLTMLMRNPTFFQEVAALQAGDYVLSQVDSPRREEMLDVLRALLSYVHYAGYITLQQYQQITGEQNPVPADQINNLIDSFMID